MKNTLAKLSYGFFQLLKGKKERKTTKKLKKQRKNKGKKNDQYGRRLQL